MSSHTKEKSQSILRTVVSQLKNSTPRQRIILTVLLFAFVLIGVGIYSAQSPKERRSQASEVDTQTQAPGQDQGGEEAKPDYVPGEVVVKFMEPLEVAAGVQAMTASGESIFDVQSVSLQSISAEGAPQAISILERYNAREVEKIFKDQKDPETELSSLQATGVVQNINREAFLKVDLSRIYKVEYEEDIDPFLVARELKKSRGVEYAHPNYILEASQIPTDPFYSDQTPPASERSLAEGEGGWNPPYDYQWNMDMINVEPAWNITKGNEDIIVAVVDTGVDYTHEDIDDNIWVNQIELSAAGNIDEDGDGYYDVGNGIDDDGNGYVDDMYGLNVLALEEDYRGDYITPLDDQLHGTHVAGIIAAEHNNIGLAGVAPQVKIQTIKVLSRFGFGSTEDVALGVRYAADNGSNIINLSLGSLEFVDERDALDEAIEYAYALNSVVVVAAGNDYGRPLVLSSPANNARAIAVSAISQKGLD